MSYMRAGPWLFRRRPCRCPKQIARDAASIDRECEGESLRERLDFTYRERLSPGERQRVGEQDRNHEMHDPVGCGLEA